ncbi:mitochondrial import protein Pam17-domain-containing protein [Lophiotrema nucula]|uniref:Presequence translocated-associated motor subunit PAM17 n=1 Tax=Lophiotrema nucula TaxID=690887 RepID=A0A6A5Z1M0_9PLEO|nr:mitochondrial import protein Pam17-domain-containing protein [Lophiotrema nucula]
MIATSCACYSTSTRPNKIPRTASSSSLTSSISKALIKAPAAVRYASTASAGTPEPNMNPSQPPPQLTWNRFLELRRTRRKISVLASSVTAAATVFGGLRVSLDNNWDSMAAASIGLDPLIVTGLGFVGFLATGWLIGPFFGNAIFNTYYRNIRGDIEAKEREFYNRIKRHRVDPTSSSMANPVPDYYGEKIGSVAGYRRWLKDQRAFNLKRGAYTGSK